MKENISLLGKIVRGIQEITRVDEEMEGEVIETDSKRRSARGFTMEWARTNPKAREVLKNEYPSWFDHQYNGEAYGMIKGQSSPDAKANRSMAKAISKDIRRQLYEIYLEEQE